MNNKEDTVQNVRFPIWSKMPLPAKALATAVIFVFSLAMMGALGQIIIHDIIPTFYSASSKVDHTTAHQGDTANNELSRRSEARGDLFADMAISETKDASKPFYQSEQFVWTLKWTHIHLFGMNMIFILMGGIVLFLNISIRARTWLIILPFFGVLVDIAAMWLKGFISPIFFWLHLPGGFLFGAIFIFVSLKALKEMWFSD